MTTQQIRRNIHITDFHLNVNALSISYKYFDKPYSFIALPHVALPILKAALVIDNYAHVNHILQAKLEGKVMLWDYFVASYKLNQYDCIEIITRHIFDKELETDANILEMDEALNALKNI